MLASTLYGKMVVFLVTLFLLLAVLFVVVAQVSSERYHHEVSQKLHRNLARNIVSHHQFFVDDQLDPNAIPNLFDQAMSINPSIEIYLLDLQGHILGYSAPAGRVTRKQIDLSALNHFFDGLESLPIYADDPRQVGRKKIFSAAPIIKNDKLKGYLYIILGGEKHENVLQMLRSSHNQRLMLAILFAALVFGLTAALIGFSVFTRRLRKLVAAISFFEESNFSLRPNHLMSPISANKTDEIDHLAIAFSEMADRIIVQVDKLKNAEKSRRELTTNVSHDLRTPLAALSGYVETVLLRDDKLTPEQRIQYLTIASKHCERMGKLIEELFELGTLDSPSIVLNEETFDIGDLMSDIVLKFQLRAEQQHINFRLNIADDLPQVFADIGLIERVLDNLIENALRYTPPAGFIELEVFADNTQIIAHVNDSGTGIPAKEIPHIFDRHYRLRYSATDKSTRAGLGLAITKRILELHNGTIEVSSSKGHGTRFTFKLPLK